MLRTSIKITFAILAVSLVNQNLAPKGAPSPFQARADQDANPAAACTLATIKGNYGLTLTGKATGYGEVSGVGTVSLDGAGKYSGSTSGVVSAGGMSTVYTTPVNGTYTLESDCSGKVVVNFVNLGLSVEGVTVFTNGGNNGSFIVTAPTTAQLSGAAQRQ